MLKELTRRVTRNLGVEVTRTAQRRGLSLFTDLKRLLGTEDAALFDVGANIGGFTRSLADVWPDRDIYACEPVPSTARRLREQVASLPNVTVVEAAFGDRCGAARMMLTAQSVWNHITTEDAPGETIAVELLTIDDLCERSGIPRIGLLKTDCEGYDFAAVRGAERMLTNRAVDAVYCEVGFRRDGGGNDFYAIDEYLRRFGLHFYAIYDYSSPGPNTSETFANALWIPATAKS